MTNSKIRPWVINALIAALYIVLSLGPASLSMASGAVQFRISESLNHLVTFNKKYIWGVVGGVIIFNLLFSSENRILDMVFGGGQTLLALLVLIVIQPRLKKQWQKMVLNVALFTVSMCLIAWMIVLTGSTGSTTIPFWPIYATTALSEFIIMAISAPIMYYLDKVLHFSEQIEKKA